MKTKKLLKCDLDKGEIEARKNSLVKASQRLETQTADKASAMQEHNAGLKATRTEIRALLAAIQTGCEEREVMCEERSNDRLGTVTTVRLDTGAVIHERPQTADERQLKLLKGKPEPEPEDPEAEPEESKPEPEPAPKKRRARKEPK